VIALGLYRLAVGPEEAIRKVGRIHLQPRGSGSCDAIERATIRTKPFELRLTCNRIKLHDAIGADPIEPVVSGKGHELSARRPVFDAMIPQALRTQEVAVVCRDKIERRSRKNSR
jgi:hypothetical protein